MKKILSLIISVILLSLSLSGCGEVSESFVIENADTSYYSQFMGKDIELNVANWGEYISDGLDDGSSDVIYEFEKLTGISVNYTTYATNEELYAKMKAGAANYDIIIPSDYMISKMANEGMLAELDFNNIPNYKNISEAYKGLEFDTDNKYSVPYFWGTVGIIYNKNMVNSDSDFGWEILWDEKYKDNILMFDNPRDAFAIAQIRLNQSLNTTDAGELTKASDLLKEQKPLVQAYVMDEIFDKMGAEEAAVAPYYAGDAMTLMKEYDFLGFKVPREGTNMFVDSFCIPKTAQNKAAAEMFINFMLEAEVGLENTEYVCYSTPNKMTYELLSDEVKNDGFSYPDNEYLKSHTEAFCALTPEADKLMSELWTQIRSEND